jgi:all-trans-retinol dehydrogenase (NAD+)
MPAREGFTFDTVLDLIKKTALNPAITVPLYIASLYTEKGKALAAERPIAAKWLESLFALSVMRSVSGFLDKGVMNNWTNDVFNWEKEIVVVTGGSDGIGALVVQMLAQKGIKIVVLDIQKPKYEGE